MPTVTINGVDLRATLGVIATVDSALQTVAAMGSSAFSLPGRHGSVNGMTEEFYETGHLILSCWLDGTGSPTVHQQRLDGLLGLLYGSLDVRKTMPDGSIQQALCYQRASIDPDHRPGAWTKLTVPLEVPGVFWRDVTAQSFTQTQPVSGTPYTMTAFAGCTAPVEDAKVLWTGPISNPQATDPWSGSSVTWQGTVAAGTQVRVDADTMTAVAGTGIGLNGAGSDVSGSLVPSGPGSGFRLLHFVPEMVGTDPLNRRLRVTVTGSGITSATSVQVSARRAFL